MHRRFLAAAFLLAACPAHTPEPPHVIPDAATTTTAADAASNRVAETPRPKLRLPTTFAPTGYTAHLAIDPQATTFAGTITIDATLTEPASVIWLNAKDLQISQATAQVGGQSVALRAEVGDDGLLGLHAASDLPAGELQVAMTYQGAFRTNDSTGAFVQEDGGDKYVITQFEPIDARAVFPCFDEPSSKVPWTLTLDVPKDDLAISNAPVSNESDLGNGMKTVSFATTAPLPSYLVAFAVGPFEMVDAGKTPGGKPIHIATFKGKSADAAYAATTAPKLIAILEDYFGIPYPYDKLDLVPIPTTTWFGAMENAGMITFAQNLLLMPKGSSPNQRRTFDWVAGHEMAHQWFGDFVTLSWWDDIWLNEAFATWMEEKVMRKRPGWIDGEESHDRARGLGSDELVTARRVRQPIETPDDIQTAFDNITYQKGSAVIRMFEHWVGPEAFRAGVQQYLAGHAFRTADVHDFLDAVDASTPKDLTAAFSSFLDQGGAPLVTATTTCSGGKATVALTQTRWLAQGVSPPAGAAPHWQIPVCVAYGDGKKRGEQCTVLDADTSVALDMCPTWVLPNRGAVGYYHGGLDKDAFAALIAKGWKQLTQEEQQLVVNDGSAMIAHGDLAPDALLDLIPLLLKGSRLEVDQATGMVGSAWPVVDDATRPALENYVRKTFAPRARKLGWMPSAKDTIDSDAERGAMVSTDAFIGRDPKLLASAGKLAKKWKDLPDAVRGQVLAAAVLASPAFGKQLLGELDGITDRRLHEEAIGALTTTEDPELAKTLLARLLDPKHDLVQEQSLMFGLSHVGMFDVVEQFIYDHYDEIAPRMAELTRAYAMYPLISSCDATKRDTVAAWAKEHIAPQPGGERTMAQALEGMDQCITQRAAQGPAVNAWFAKHGK